MKKRTERLNNNYCLPNSQMEIILQFRKKIIVRNKLKNCPYPLSIRLNAERLSN
jgi:hypothetical protein